MQYKKCSGGEKHMRLIAKYSEVHQSARMSNVKKLKNGGLDQYGPEHVEV